MKINIKVFFTNLIILYLIISEIFWGTSKIFQYADEFVTFILFIHLFLKFITKKLKIGIELKKISIICFLLMILGMCSNFISGVQTNLYIIILDVVSIMKIFICTIAIANMLNLNHAKKISKSLSFLVKLFLISGLIFLPISQLYDIGMRGTLRYGIWSYKFIFGYEHVYSSLILFSLMILYSNDNMENKKFYLIISIIQMIFTTKGPSIIWGGVILFLIFSLKNKNKIKVKHIVFLAIIGILLGGYQINSYLLNVNAPRYLFYKYGAITANRYFPLGSGFATFGSDMAADNYSKLYYSYGFNSLFGMSPNNKAFLNDNYWPMIYAQFGWIGLIGLLYCFYLVFLVIQKSKMNYFNKSILISVFVYLLVHSLGSSILTSSVAIIVCIGFTIMYICKHES